MFAWRKKTDGFEWHQYIRTAVRNRRQQRRERMLEARRAAGQQMQAAGVALAEGSRAAGVAAKEGAKASIGAAGLLAGGLSTLFVTLSIMIGRLIAVLARPVIAVLARPGVGSAVLLGAAFVLGIGVGRARALGFDGETYLTLGFAALLFVCSLPMLSRATGIRMPNLGNLGLSPAAGLAAILLIAAAAGGAAWYTKGGQISLPRFASSLPLIGESKTLEGRAYAVNGDSLQIGGTVVRLAGIEAPAQDQRCGTGNRRWRCGAAATEALARLVNGRVVACTLSGKDARGRSLASCTMGNTDINAELVRRGYVFAETGLFARYSSLEGEARAAKAGVWATGDAERPADYRARQKRPGV